MQTSYNGALVGSAAELGITTYPVPGSKVRLALLPAAAPLLLWVAHYFDARIQNIDTSAGHRSPDDWGYAYRNTRGASTWSNHASGTAIDLNATQYPRGTTNMSAARVKKVRAMLKRVNKAAGRAVLAWGGDYVRSPKDQMHFELTRPITKREAEAIVAKLDGSKSSKFLSLANVSKAFRKAPHTQAPRAIRAMQKGLKAKGFLRGGYIPGVAGGKTRRAFYAWETANGRNGRGIPTAAEVRALAGPGYVIRGD